MKDIDANNIQQKLKFNNSLRFAEKRSNILTDNKIIFSLNDNINKVKNVKELFEDTLLKSSWLKNNELQMWCLPGYSCSFVYTLLDNPSKISLITTINSDEGWKSRYNKYWLSFDSGAILWKSNGYNLSRNLFVIEYRNLNNSMKFEDYKSNNYKLI